MSEKIGLEGELDLSSWDRGVQSYLSSIDKMVGASSRFAGGVVSEYGKLGGVITGVGASVAASAALMGGAAAKAGLSWIGEGVTSAAELEAQMSGIAAVMNRTKDEVEPLKQVIQDLSIDPALKVNTFQAADAIELLARNGLDITDIMNGAARSTVLLANATSADFGTAADIATDAMSIFNISAEDMSEAINGITSVVNNSKFDINDYYLALSRGAVSMAAAGVSFDDFNSVLAYTASSFSSGQVAGTGWANLITRMIPQSNDAAEAMRELGIITADGANQFFTAGGEMKDMGQIIDVLNGAFGGLSEEQRIAYSHMIFGRDAANALNSVIGKTGAEFTAYKDTLGRTDAEESAKTRMDNLAGAMEILRGILEAVQIQVGDKFLPALDKLGGALGGVLGDKADVIVGMFSGIAEWAARAVEAMIPFVENQLPALIDNAALFVKWLTEWVNSGQPVNEWLGQMDGMTMRWAERLTGMMTAFRTARAGLDTFIQSIANALAPVTDFLSKHVEWEDVLIAAGGAVLVFLTPLGLAIAKMAAVGAAASLAVAAIRDAWENNLGGVRDVVQRTWEQIQGIVETGQAIITELFGRKSGALAGVAESVWNGVQATIETALTAIQGVMSVALLLIQGDWKGAWAALKKTGGGVLDGIKEQVDNRLSLLGGIFGERMSSIQESVDRAWEAIKDIVETIVGTIEGIIEAHGDEIVAALEWAWNDAKTIVDETLANMATLLEGLAALLRGDWETAWTKAGEAVTGAMQTIGDAFQRRFDAIKELLAGPGAKATSWFKETFPQASEALGKALERVQGMWEDLAAAWSKATEKIAEVTGELLEKIQAWWEEHGDEVMELVDIMLSFIIDSFTNFTEAVTSLLTAFLLLISGDWEGAMEEFKDVGEAAWEQIKNIFSTIWDAIALIFQTALSDLVTKMTNGAADMVAAFRDGLSTFGSEVKTKIDEAIATFTAPLTNLHESFKNWGRGALDGFIAGVNEKMQPLRDAVNAIGSTVGNVLGISLEAQSPSRLTMRYGEWAGEGFIEGIDRMLQRLRETAGRFADVALRAIGDPGSAAVGGMPALAAGGAQVGAGWESLLAGRLGLNAPAPRTVQSYATTNHNSMQFGPITIQQPMDVAELEYRFRQNMIATMQPH